VPSYQDIEIRLRHVEDKLDFVMSHARMKAAVTTGVVDSNGRPQAKVFEGSLKELYYLSRSLPVIDQEDAPPPAAEPVGASVSDLLSANIGEAARG
jgi:hypothetical protein